MNPRITDPAVIDLSDRALTSDEIDARHDELERVERKIEALEMRKHILICELGLEMASPVLVADIDEIDEVDHVTMGDVARDVDSRLFLDSNADVFGQVHETAPVRDEGPDFELNDVDFDERFAAFASSDGDHQARRWLDG